jgi:enoyl-CoA hydratase/carnithine racemase
MTNLNPRHFDWVVNDRVAVITLNRPEKKNPLTFESYAELRDTFRKLATMPLVRGVILRGAGGNFCSGGDVHEIIGPLVTMKREGRHEDLRRFTQMTGDLVKAMRHCPQPILAAVDGVAPAPERSSRWRPTSGSGRREAGWRFCS